MNDKIIKAMAFEKAVLEVLKSDNAELRENYCVEERLGRKIDYDEKMIFRRFHYDAVSFGSLYLQAFNKEPIFADKIAVEIRFDHPNMEKIRYIIQHAENNFDVIVFIFAFKKSKSIEEKLKSTNCKLYFIFMEDLVKNKTIKSTLFDLDDYILSENNVLIDDNYPLLKKTKNNLSFAIGSGCSKGSHISDWDTLSKALGYELLYDIVNSENKYSKYKNKLITDALNESLFKCFDKNSALDAIYNSFMIASSASRGDYWFAIKKVLYMAYDSPNDAQKPLMNSIVACIKRRKIDTVINYNFDSVLEQNINHNYKSNKMEIQNSQTQMIGCTIYHVHGFIPYDYDGRTEVNNFVFTDNEYYENMIDPNSFSNKTQTDVLQNKNIIFVGVSFTDSNMKEILRRRKKSMFSNYIFAFMKLPDFDFEGTNNKLIENKYKFIQERYFDTLGVKVLWVNKFEEIPNIIDSI